MLLASLALLAGASLPARAIEYLTVEAPAVLYDAPSVKGVKLFVIKRDTPVEVTIVLDGLVKVRDAEGSMAWIEAQYLAPRRTVIVKVDLATIRQRPEGIAPMSFEAERDVSLEYLETLPGGWARVRHPDGQEGFAHASEVWGF
jgi:SH3-like domain-containing protein